MESGHLISHTPWPQHWVVTFNKHVRTNRDKWFLHVHKQTSIPTIKLFIKSLHFVVYVCSLRNRFCRDPVFLGRCLHEFRTAHNCVRYRWGTFFRILSQFVCPPAHSVNNDCCHPTFPMISPFLVTLSNSHNIQSYNLHFVNFHVTFQLLSVFLIRQSITGHSFCNFAISIKESVTGWTAAVGSFTVFFFYPLTLKSRVWNVILISCKFPS